MSLSHNLSSYRQQHYLHPDKSKDQHFLINKSVLQDIIHAAQLQPDETVLEIGAGTGILTRELTQRVKKVIAIENDSRFLTLLHSISPVVEVVQQSALPFLEKTKRQDFTKIISNIPYQICEPLFRYLCRAHHLQCAVLTVPLSFAHKVQQHPFFPAFLKIELIREVPKESFSPPPRVRSAVIRITPIRASDKELFIRRKLFFYWQSKVKNALLEILIDWHSTKDQRRLTKREAVKLIAQAHLPPRLLEKPIHRLSAKECTELCQRIVSRL